MGSELFLFWGSRGRQARAGNSYGRAAAQAPHSGLEMAARTRVKVLAHNVQRGSLEGLHAGVEGRRRVPVELCARGAGGACKEWEHTWMAVSTACFEPSNLQSCLLGGNAAARSSFQHARKAGWAKATLVMTRSGISGRPSTAAGHGWAQQPDAAWHSDTRRPTGTPTGTHSAWWAGR